jgi:hypothetical protein
MKITDMLLDKVANRRLKEDRLHRQYTQALEEEPDDPQLAANIWVDWQKARREANDAELEAYKWMVDCRKHPDKLFWTIYDVWGSWAL